MKTPSFGQWGRVLSTVAGLLILSAFANPDLTLFNERSVWSGVYSTSQAERGRTAFETTCAMCHSADLSGRGAIPALRGDAFTSERHGGTVGDLYQLVSTTMPPGRPTALSPEGYADVVAYLLNANSFPAGEADLPHHPETLHAIVFDQRSATAD